MGAFDVVPNITIPDPTDPAAAAKFRKMWRWEEHELVMIKGSVNVADQEYVTNHYGVADQKGAVEYRMGNGRYAILDRMIVDWTLLQNGHKVAVTPSSIKRLPSNYSMPILEVIDELGKSLSPVEQEDFLDSANGRIVESSESTNLSLMKS